MDTPCSIKNSLFAFVQSRFWNEASEFNQTWMLQVFVFPKMRVNSDTEKHITQLSRHKICFVVSGGIIKRNVIYMRA